VVLIPHLFLALTDDNRLGSPQQINQTLFGYHFHIDNKIFNPEPRHGDIRHFGSQRWQGAEPELPRGKWEWQAKGENTRKGGK